MKYLLLFILLTCTSFPAEAQLDTANLPETIKKFIPVEYSVLDLKEGDLNDDSYKDVLLILRKNGEDTAMDDYKRPLLILSGNENNTFNLAAESDKVVYCVHCGGIMGDPYTTVSIENGKFTIHHYGGSAWRWTNDISFRYDSKQKAWYLLSIVDSSFHAGNPNRVKKKVRNVKQLGRVPFTAFDVYAE